MSIHPGRRKDALGIEHKGNSPGVMCKSRLSAAWTYIALCGTSVSYRTSRPREFFPVRLVIPVPAPPHLVIGGIILVLSEKQIGLEPFNVAGRKHDVPNAPVSRSHQTARPFIPGATVNLKPSGVTKRRKWEIHIE